MHRKTKSGNTTLLLLKFTVHKTKQKHFLETVELYYFFFLCSFSLTLERCFFPLTIVGLGERLFIIILLHFCMLSFVISMYWTENKNYLISIDPIYTNITLKYDKSRPLLMDHHCDILQVLWGYLPIYMKYIMCNTDLEFQK